MPIIAKFHAQASYSDRDSVFDIAPQGPDTWDVTGYVLGIKSVSDLDMLKDDTPETDVMRELPNAPEWVRNWAGPFRVEVEDAITAYFEAVGKAIRGEGDEVRG